MTIELSRLSLWIMVAVAKQPLHPYGVVEQMKSDMAGGEFANKRSVYAAIIRLEREGILESVNLLVGQRKLRQYSLTTYGRRLLRVELGQQQNLVILLRQRLCA